MSNTQNKFDQLSTHSDLDSRTESNDVIFENGFDSSHSTNESPLLQTFSHALNVNEDLDNEPKSSDIESNFVLNQREFDDNDEKLVDDSNKLDVSLENDEPDLPIEQEDEWRSQSKHIFILSESGKPIYSLHGNEVKLIAFMGLLQALISIIECDNDNRLNYVLAGELKIVFLHQSHLILVCISNEPDKCVEQLQLELEYCYNQIISVVTLSLIEKIFSKHHNYDLRNKLSGTEKLLTNIIHRFKNDYGMLLNCVNSYPLPQENRVQVSKLVDQQIAPLRSVIFGLFLFENKLVSLIQPKSRNIHPVDVHLLVNVITGFDTPKSAEFTWYPICLPNFDKNGIMYAYISHLDESCQTCLILLTGICDEEQSIELNECRKSIQQKMQSQNLIQLMNSKLNDNSLKLDQIGVNELKHFLYKDNKIFQYFLSDYALPYANNASEQQRIFDMYQRLYHKLHNKTNSLKIIYLQKKYETIFGWQTSSFEIYATFSPLVTKEIAIIAVKKLLEFTQKNKSKIFLTLPR